MRFLANLIGLNYGIKTLAINYDIKVEKLAEDAKAIDLVVRAEVKEAVPSVVPKGAVVKGTWEYDIVNPAELYKAHPDCFKLEPVKSEIAKLLDETNGKLPGVERAIKVFKTNLRG